MNLRVNPTSGEPVYRQLVWQVKRAVARGELRAGEQLPSVRDLAGQLLINPNTIARAYREMEAEGLIYGQPGRGFFVHEDNGVELTEAAQRRILSDLIERVVVEARHMGVSKADLAAMFEQMADGFDRIGGSGGGEADE